MKWLLRADSFASYSLDRCAARPWNQSSWLSEERKLIPVEAQMVKSADGFTVCYKSHSGLLPGPWIVGLWLYLNLTKLNSPVCVPVGEGRGKERTTGNSFLFRWTSGLRGFINNPQGPSPAVPTVPLSFLYPFLLLRLPSYIRTTAFVLPPSTVTNWHAEFSNRTLNPGDQA